MSLQAPIGSSEGDDVWVETLTVRSGVYLARTISRVIDGEIVGQLVNTTSEQVHIQPHSLPIEVALVAERGNKTGTAQHVEPIKCQLDNSKPIFGEEGRISINQRYPDMNRALMVEQRRSRGEE